MSKSLVVGGQQMTLSDFGGVVNAKGGLVGARNYIAGQAGITLPVVKKGETGPTMKEVKAQILALGKTEADIKAWSKEYDAKRGQFYAACGQLNGMLAADPTFRKHVKISVNAKGVAIGATTSYRKERSATAAQSTIAALEARIALLTKALGAPAA
jgi:hypothetical protein